MALTNTTLAAGCDATARTLTLTSTTGFPAVGTYGSRQLMRVGGEYMLVDYVPVSGTVKVAMRGYNGTTAQAHDIGTEVSTSASPADFAQVPVGAVNTPSPWDDDVLTIGEDLAFTAAGTAPVLGTSIPIPIKNTTYYLNKGSAAAITLISATAAQQGVRVRFVNQAAQANTITYTPGFLGDTTSSDVATASAKVGASFEIICGPTGLWAPINTGTGTGWTLG